MKKIKVNYIKTIDNSTFKVNYYSNDYYEVKEKIYYDDKEESFKIITISKKIKDIQSIEVIEEDDEIISFRIQTTSYGSLDKENIQELINEYQITIDTVEQLEKIFLK